MDIFMIAYIHARPDGTPFYVGKGSGTCRMNRMGRRNRYHTNITKKYGSDNILKGFLECSTESIAFELERGLIKCLKNMGLTLANMTEGGEGTSGASEETRARMRENNLGKILNEEHKSKIGRANSKPLDKNIYHFSHKEHGSENTTRWELAKKYGLDVGHLGKIIHRKGYYHSHKGWRVKNA
jgi:hypothetical protein